MKFYLHLLIELLIAIFFIINISYLDNIRNLILENNNCSMNYLDNN